MTSSFGKLSRRRDEGGDQVDQGHRHRRQQRGQADLPPGRQVDVEEIEAEQPEDGDQAQEEPAPSRARGRTAAVW